MADWSSLPSDLVRRVGYRLLATEDLDYYMDMRGVCRNWRSATDDPCRCGAAGVGLLRFCPRQWVMLHDDDDGDACLFLNISTGRFIRRRRIPMLHDGHIVVAASDGLLVLGDRKYPHAARVLNPLTGALLRFAAPIPRGTRVRAAVTGASCSGSGPSLVFSSSHGPYSDAVSCSVDPTSSELSSVQFGPLLLASMVPYAGHVYMASRDGLILKCDVRTSSQQHCHGELVAKASDVMDVVGDIGHCGGAFLVVSAGELLLVCRLRRGGVEVFRVDVDRKVLEPVKSVGRRALFLGERCLSVDADELPSVQGNCMYYLTKNVYGVCKYDLEDGSEKRISSFRVRPFSLVQALLNYCVVLPDVKAQLHRMYRTSQG